MNWVADEQGGDLAALVSPLPPSSMTTTMDWNHSEDEQLQNPQECQTQPVLLVLTPLQWSLSSSSGCWLPLQQCY